MMIFGNFYFSHNEMKERKTARAGAVKIFDIVGAKCSVRLRCRAVEIGHLR